MNALLALGIACFGLAFYYLAFRPIDDLPLFGIFMTAGSLIITASARLMRWRIQRQLADLRRRYQ